MRDLAEGMSILAGQLNRLKDILESDELGRTISEFPGMMEEVADFIAQWLESWLGEYLAGWDRFMTELLVAAKHILFVPHEDQAIKLRKKLDTYAGIFDPNVSKEIREERGLVFMADIHRSTWLICGLY